ncbi:FtsX-like permease family protein, partial [Dokdonella sp.]|uniref:FtsX-like permease family protein n=1 Tax=Dokdonella sp. TaxID=2291710 RepID=UPI003C5397EF
AAAALLLATFAARAVDRAFRTAADGPPHWIHFELDSNIVLLTLAVAVLTALVAGLLPALRAGGDAMSGGLRDGARTMGAGTGRASRVLMVGEVAFSLALLMAVGTMIRGVSALESPELGIITKGILTARIGLFESAYPNGADQVHLFERVIDTVRRDPAVVDATAGTNLPGLEGWTREVVADGGDIDHDGALPRINFSAVDDRYLSTYGIKLVEGRFFDSRDVATSAAVAVVDQRFVEQHGQQGSVLGSRFRLDPASSDQALVTVVGVTSSIALDSPVDPPRPSLLAPLRQQPARFASLAIRVKGDPATFAPKLVEAIREVDADTPAYWVRTYDQVIRDATFDTRMLAKLFGIFGLLALVLAGAGLYGVIAFNVAQRTREIGVRRALGARTGNVLRNVLARAGWHVGIGVALGLGLGFALIRVLASALHGVAGNSIDGNGVFGVLAALGVLLFAAAVAVVLPARRALRIDPMIALRDE